MVKVLSLFSGYGTDHFALKKLGILCETIGYSDIDKYANQCFQQNHGGKELGDVRKVDPNTLGDFDLLTAGFPCQSFSNAGKMGGESDPRGTLFYEIIRIAEVKKPKYMLLENVKGLTCKKFKDTFAKILSELDRIGYNVYWKVLNSKDFGIPQSRARVWFVCFRKDIDTKTFQFPEPTELKIFIKDILETEVDPKYYLSGKLQERFNKYLEDKNAKLGKDNPAILDLYNHKIKTDGTSITLSDPCHNNLRLIEGESNIVAMRSYPRTGKDDENRTQNIEPREDGCSNTITNVQKDNLVFDNATNKATEQVYEVNPENDMERPSYIQYQNGNHSEAHRVYNVDGISQTMKPGGLKVYIQGEECSAEIKGIQLDVSGKGHRSEQDRLYHDTGVMACIPSTRTDNKVNIIESNQVANCLKSRDYKGAPSPEYVDRQDFNLIGNVGKLRRLTPKECFRLMGFLNDEINLDGLSDTQRYKLAGNGQDVNIVTKIFKEMLLSEKTTDS